MEWRSVFVFLAGFILLISTNLKGQSRVDSLESELAKASHDTVRLQCMVGLVEELGPTPEGIKYNEQMGVLAKAGMNSSDPSTVTASRIKYITFLGNAGYIAEINGDIPLALQYYNEGIELSKEGVDPLVYASLLNNIGYVYSGLGDMPRAMSYYRSALHIRDSLNDKRGIATCINNLAGIYRDQGELDTALVYYERFTATCAEIKDSSGIALGLNNIGKMYITLHDTLKAREYLDRSYAISVKIGDEKEIGHSLYGKALLSFESGDFVRTRAYLEDAIDHQKRAGHMRSMASSMLKLAETELKLGEHELALQYASESHEIALKTGYLDLIQRSAGTLKNVYRQTGNDSLALVMYELEVKMRDSITNETNRKLIIRNGLEREFELKTVELEQISQREKLIRNFALGGLGIVLIFLVFVIIQRNNISKERKRSDALLLNILPSAVAEELKVTGKSETQAFDEVTVLFTDFKGFTQISERLSPKELVQELDEHFKAFDAIMEKYGVEKIKTIGDSYMAAGGLPVANTTNPFDVVTAAMDIKTYMENVNAGKQAGKEVFEIRIGIHTGPIVAGIVGVKKFAYDIWGDTVNTASRMESSGEAGKVNISESTYQHVKDNFNCTYRGNITAKNKGEIAMYFVDSSKT